MDVGNLISGSSAFSKSNLYIWKFLVHVLLKPSLKDFEHSLTSMVGFPCDSAGKESTCSVGDLGSTPGLGRSPGEGKPTHSSVLAWRIPGTVQSVGLQRSGHD